MIQAVGNISSENQGFLKKCFEKHGLEIIFSDLSEIESQKVISFDKNLSSQLNKRGRSFYNWDLLFSVLGPNDTVDELEKKIDQRILILKSLLKLKSKPVAQEFHGSIRVKDLADSAAFYTWLFGVEPKEWTHRYVTFTRSDIGLNFVLLVADNLELHHDTLYHLGMGVCSKEKVVEFYHSAIENGFTVEKPPRTTWRGTPLHELWLKDPDGTLIEVYSRLTDEELKMMPENMEPVFL